MSSSFRIDASELQAWQAALAARLDVRGVAAIAKEMEAHLARQDADGAVVVTRHQMFTWAEALEGAAARDPRAASAGAQLSLPQVVADMRGILAGKPVAPGARPEASPPPAPRSSPPPAPEARPEVVPPVVYGPPAAPAGLARGAVRVVTGAELAATVRELVRGAKGALYVCSPWDTGVETLAADLVALPPHVRVLLLSRRPARDDAAFHQAMDQLGRRRAVTAWSPYIQTRMVIQDRERALVGAASIPGAASRETAVLVTDPGAIAALRAHFERGHQEAAGGKY